MKKLKSVVLSVRFKTLILGQGPVFVGVCLSFTDFKSFAWLLNGALCFCVLCIQIATHFFNDGLDFVKGTDSLLRKGPERAVAKGLISPSQALKIGFIFLLLASLVGVFLAVQGGWPIVLVGLISLTLAYCYTGGPFPLSYTGFADLFVLLFFGLIPVSFVFYLNTGYFSGGSFIAGLQCGFLALSLLTLNNLRDEKSDRLSNKKTLVVRWGRKWGIIEWGLAHFLPYLLGLCWLFKGLLFAGLLPFLLLPFAFFVFRLLFKSFKEPALYAKVFAYSLWNYFFFFALLSLGLRL